jgi:hypothetical protein
MTELLQKALDAARRLPRDEQDEIAGAILQLLGAENEKPIALTLEERAAIQRSREAANRGEFASDEAVQAVWSRHAS